MVRTRTRLNTYWKPFIGLLRKMKSNKLKERSKLLKLLDVKSLREVPSKKKLIGNIISYHYSRCYIGSKVEPWVKSLSTVPLPVIKIGNVSLCRKSNLIKYAKDNNLILPFSIEDYPDIFVIGFDFCIRTNPDWIDYNIHAFFGVFDPMSPKQFYDKYGYKRQASLRFLNKRL